MRNVLNKICTEDRNTYFMANRFLFSTRKSCPLCDNVEKYGRSRQVTDDNTTRCLCIACWI